MADDPIDAFANDGWLFLIAPEHERMARAGKPDRNR